MPSVLALTLTLIREWSEVHENCNTSVGHFSGQDAKMRSLRFALIPHCARNTSGLTNDLRQFVSNGEKSCQPLPSSSVLFE